MASIGHEIKIAMEMRPCWVSVYGKKKKALFHRWFEFSYLALYAVVEYEDGKMDKVDVEDVVFVPENFADYSWGAENESES